jgi:hypothetical protein
MNLLGARVRIQSKISARINMKIRNGGGPWPCLVATLDKTLDITTDCAASQAEKAGLKRMFHKN